MYITYQNEKKTVKSSKNVLKNVRIYTTHN